MKKWVLILAAAVAVLQLAQLQRGPQSVSGSDSAVTDARSPAGPQSARNESPGNERALRVDSEASDPLSQAFRERRHNVQVSGEGTVARLLADDNQGSRHQRFLLRLPSGQTVLIAHNVDLAPRLEDLRAGETIAFSGEYEWNERGGVIHWTHRDPGGRHAAGWLRRGGRLYQ